MVDGTKTGPAAQFFASSYYDMDTRQCILSTDRSDGSSSFSRRFIPLSLLPAPDGAAQRTRERHDSTPLIIALLGGLNPIGCGGKVDMCPQFLDGACNGKHPRPEAVGFPQDKYGYNMVDDAEADLNDVLRSLGDGTGNPCLCDGVAAIIFDEKDKEKGSYTIETQIIRVNPALMDHGSLYGDAHKMMMLFRLYHELGHHVNNSVLNHFCPESSYPVQFAGISWDTYSGKMKPDMNPDVDSGDFLNADAIRNSDEDFAVSFAYYVWMPGEFRRRKQGHPALESKYEFMKSLFKGREFQRDWDVKSGQ